MILAYPNESKNLVVTTTGYDRIIVYRKVYDYVVLFYFMGIIVLGVYNGFIFC